jgi:hypothetical protein
MVAPTWEVEMQKIPVQGQLKPPSSKKKEQKGLRAWFKW